MKEIAFMAVGLIALQFGCFLVGKYTSVFSVEYITTNRYKIRAEKMFLDAQKVFVQCRIKILSSNFKSYFYTTGK
jgi:membrane protein CcdC involved in cytochrome C biogenesis